MTRSEMTRSEWSKPSNPAAGKQPPAPPHTLPSVLPRPLTSFIGRKAETEQLLRLLLVEEVQIVTLTGQGGIGKTRLALHAAEQFPHVTPAYEVAFISLAAVTMAGEVLPEIAQQLGVRTDMADNPLAGLGSVLRGRHLLLVLDNLEQVWTAGPKLVELAAGCPHVKMLITSRRRLRISGEHVLAVPPLGVPPSGDDCAPVSGESPHDAVRLFAERAAAVRGDFQVNQQNVADIRAICQRLDGLPLAIELAAARSDALSPPSLRALLESRLILLTGGAQDAPARHHTLQQAITWSSDLLTPEERLAFARLAVFSGGFGLGDAAAVVAEGASSSHMLETLLMLSEQSLVVPDSVHRADVEPRFIMLETIREVALGQLLARGEEEATRQRHAERFRQVAAQAKPELNGFRQREWMERLERDLHNIRAALTWLITTSQADLAMGLAGDLLMFWLKRAHVAEGRAWLERALALPPGESSPIRLHALVASCVMAGPSGDLPRAAQALAMAQALGDRAAEGRLRMLHGSPILTTQPEAAREHFAQALALHEAVDDQPWRAVALMMLGLAAGRLGQPEQAMGYLDAAIAVSDEVGDLWTQLLARQATATIARLAGNHAEAAALALACLEATLELGDGVGANEALIAFAGILLDLGQAHHAAQMFGAAELLRETAGLSTRHLLVSGQYEQDVAATSASLGNEMFLEAWRDGRANPQAELARRAQELLPPARVAAIPRRVETVPRYAKLTARELDVLRLLVERRTDREISQILYIGLRTVEFHVANILGKLEAPNRYEAGPIAARLGVL